VSRSTKSLTSSFPGYLTPIQFLSLSMTTMVPAWWTWIWTSLGWILVFIASAVIFGFPSWKLFRLRGSVCMFLVIGL